MSQLAFDLPHRASHRGDDFLVSPSNRAAVQTIDRWPDWPSHALALVGPPASGKSHLAAVWQAKAKARRLQGAELAARSRLMSAPRPAVIVEDADVALARPKEQGGLDPVDLFHLFNWMRERGGYLLMTARTPPPRWPVGLPDLKSRLASIPVAAIAAPDDDLLAALIVKQLADRQLKVAPRVIDYLVTRIDRSFAAADAAVSALDAASLEAKRAITVPLAKQVLERLAAG